MDIETEALMALNRLRRQDAPVEVTVGQMRRACAEINDPFDEQEYEAIGIKYGAPVGQALKTLWGEIGRTNISDLKTVADRMYEVEFSRLKSDGQ